MKKGERNLRPPFCYAAAGVGIFGVLRFSGEFKACVSNLWSRLPKTKLRKLLLRLRFLRDQSLGEPLGLVKHLKYVVEIQSESLQCGRSQCFPFAVGIDDLESALAEAQDCDGFCGEIYHPVLGYAVLGIQTALEGLVACCCGGG